MILFHNSTSISFLNSRQEWFIIELIYEKRSGSSYWSPIPLSGSRIALAKDKQHKKTHAVVYNTSATLGDNA